MSPESIAWARVKLFRNVSRSLALSFLVMERASWPVAWEETPRSLRKSPQGRRKGRRWGLGGPASGGPDREPAAGAIPVGAQHYGGEPRTVKPRTGLHRRPGA